MYNYSEIKSIHLEVTSRCNARCPMCLRNVSGGETNPQLPLKDITLNDIKKWIKPDLIRRLKKFYMCGNYGDPIVAGETLEIFKYLREINPKIFLKMFTNGSARPAQWWEELAEVVNLVNFSVDGLEDTNHIYRRGTHFPTIVRNIKAYVSKGGQADWDYIVFKHNEHQIEEARQFSEELGFNNFRVKKTGRFFSNTRMEGKEVQSVLDKNGEVEYYLEKPLQEQYQNQALNQETTLAQRYGSLEKYLDDTPIVCRVQKEKNIYISADSYVFPCCWTAGQLYPWYYKEKSSYMWKLIDQNPNGIQDISLNSRSLEEIIHGDFFQKTLPESWNKPSLSDGKPKCCAKICGSEFEPFAEQF